MVEYGCVVGGWNGLAWPLGLGALGLGAAAQSWHRVAGGVWSRLGRRRLLWIFGTQTRSGGLVGLGVGLARLCFLMEGAEKGCRLKSKKGMHRSSIDLYVRLDLQKRPRRKRDTTDERRRPTRVGFADKPAAPGRYAVRNRTRPAFLLCSVSSVHSSLSAPSGSPDCDSSECPPPNENDVLKDEGQGPFARLVSHSQGYPGRSARIRNFG